MKKVPDFTIIIPTHNRAHLLTRALTSIREQGTKFSYEIIVVSDVMDPDTGAVCQALLTGSDIFVSRNGSQGPSASRNIGLSLAKGEFVLFLDDDDAWHPGLIESLVNSQNSRPFGPVYFNCSVVKERRLFKATEFISEHTLNLAGVLTEQIYVRNQIHLSCFAFPKQTLSGLYFDENLRAYEDWDFLLSVLDRHPVTHQPFLGSKIFEVDDETTDRRGDSADAKNFNATLDYLHIYRRHPGPTGIIRETRAKLMSLRDINIPAEML